MNWNWFERRICLTLHERDWNQACAEFSRIGLTAEKFQALPITEMSEEAMAALPVDHSLIVGPHQSFNASTNQILREFYESGAETLLFLEDDCVFKDLAHLEEALAELPESWDLVYLGANLQADPVRYSEHLWRVPSAWTTHCIGYHRKVIPYLLETQPGFSEKMYDMHLSEVMAGLQAYVVSPMLAFQRPRYSAIWQKMVDYTDVFEASQARLR